ncbi:MAG: flagellar biosynthesis/type III secretory pathway protein FliH [Planctomycetota bacterium]|jgi:flagellar biosynthesis/type III secretory pathway protein FliH
MPITIKVPITRRPTGASLSRLSLAGVSDACIGERCERARQKGREEATQELSGGLGQAFERAAERLDEARETAETEVSRFAVQLSVEIAGMLTRREVDAGNYDIERIVREAMAASGIGRAPCTIHLAPSDVEKIESSAFRTGTTIEADPNLAVGDVQLSTPQGLLVRELDSCLGSIRDALLGDID